MTIGHGVPGTPVHLIPVEPVVAAVIEDNVHDDVHTSLVGGVYQVSQILARAKEPYHAGGILDA